MPSSRTTARTTTVWGMVPTPFTPGGLRIDRDSLAHLASFMLAGGCEGLIALGVIAEPARLTLEEKIEVLQTLTAAAPEAPLTAGLMSTDEAVREATSFVSASGVELSALMVPVVSSQPEELRRHLLRVHEAAGTEVIVQDLPSATGISIDVHDLSVALEGLEFVAAVKCECPPTFRRIAILAERGQYTLMSGFGGLGLIDDVVSGARSVAIGVTVTKTVSTAMTLALAGRSQEAAVELGSRASLIHYETQPGQSIAIRKEHWRRKGVITHSTVRNPTPGWTPDLKAHSDAHDYLATSSGRAM